MMITMIENRVTYSKQQKNYYPFPTHFVNLMMMMMMKIIIIIMIANRLRFNDNNNNKRMKNKKILREKIFNNYLILIYLKYLMMIAHRLHLNNKNSQRRKNKKKLRESIFNNY